MYHKPEQFPILGGNLTGHTTAWYDKDTRFREKELAPRKIHCSWVGAAFGQVKREAIKTLKRQRKNCFAVQIVVCFKTSEGVEGKVSYLAKREK